MSRQLLFSVTKDDCDLQTFSAGGKGGQNQNRRSTGVRWVHRESGATGEARDERSQLQNKKLAWCRMVESPTFQAWLKMKLGEDSRLEAQIEQAMWPSNIKTEVLEDGHWIDKQL